MLFLLLMAAVGVVTLGVGAGAVTWFVLASLETTDRPARPTAPSSAPVFSTMRGCAKVPLK